jgi:MFS family permease
MQKGVILGCGLALLLCNMCRVCMSVAIIPMAAQFGWSGSTQVPHRIDTSYDPSRGHRPLPLSQSLVCIPTLVPLTDSPARADGFLWMRAVLQGIIQSSFLWGYAAMQLLGGTLADRFGGKIVMSAGIVIFTSACAALPFTVAAVQAGAVRHPCAVCR